MALAASRPVTTEGFARGNLTPNDSIGYGPKGRPLGTGPTSLPSECVNHAGLLLWAAIHQTGWHE
ncbi:hypothetical protein RMSM_04037 [Rhodopirellula maiorica SM1]|uniref:Uncharacterized protein n=1 Tax=Rhodopirellula maiorica SM1 TaxID=1265738 RepID=M5RIA4_9BACT|nr:hypothetical protein RMSM_04037 [Rhodopirellula maiorica SM1]